MSALAHYIEEEGVATTGISLIREHTEGYAPPRFLWVPFPLGRPFGAPGDAAFQHRVLRATLALLERNGGPVLLEDFDEDAPATPEGEDGSSGWVCPVSFPAAATDDGPGARLIREVEHLAPWHALFAQRRRRTTTGLSGLSPIEAARFVAALHDGVAAPIRAELTVGHSFKLVMEDLKAFYGEAALAQPGTPTPEDVAQWFWNETEAARTLLALKPRLEASDEADLRTVAAEYLVPRTQAHRVE